ncbi:Sporulation initiation phosphotransferase F [Pontiella desulfatans]|uniref:Sporulation initiation phosphotransferase F n=1 Tax=Pontiella desulfatans TaxID=2750659 RepID=A0A6C2UAV0_PONDE|nr:response regulator [Pontiella desulfatans]VGO17145.1 Sporulation initiation phosphotransferase F [Pontiella desulfatans]
MKRILLIDDDPTVQKLFSQFLAKQGYEVLQAENGKIGMRIIGQEKPDLIITDILMPEMDGLEILLAIRKTAEELPIIAISGGMRSMPINFLNQAKMFGARYVFEKPVPLDVLLSAVRDLLDVHPE